MADIYPEVKLPETLETKVELDSTDATDAEIENALEYYLATSAPSTTRLTGKYKKAIL